MFMVSLTIFESSLTQQDVYFENHGPTQTKMDTKGVYELMPPCDWQMATTVFPWIISQIQWSPPPQLHSIVHMLYSHGHIAKPEASKQKITNQLEKSPWVYTWLLSITFDLNIFSALLARPSLDSHIWICKDQQIIGSMPWQLPSQFQILFYDQYFATTVWLGWANFKYQPKYPPKMPPFNQKKTKKTKR